MSNLRSKVASLAKEHPEFRSVLVPLLRKTATARFKFGDCVRVKVDKSLYSEMVDGVYVGKFGYPVVVVWNGNKPQGIKALHIEATPQVRKVEPKLLAHANKLYDAWVSRGWEPESGTERMAAVGKTAMEFTKAEWETYHKEHPGAKITDHNIVESKKDKKDDGKEEDEGKKDEEKKDGGDDRALPVPDGVDSEAWKKYLPDIKKNVGRLESSGVSVKTDPSDAFYGYLKCKHKGYEFGIGAEALAHPKNIESMVKRLPALFDQVGKWEKDWDADHRKGVFYTDIHPTIKRIMGDSKGGSLATQVVTEVMRNKGFRFTSG